MTKPKVEYNRAPSKQLQELLMPGGYLAPLINLNGRRVSAGQLDVHLREDEEVHVYCGLTCLLKVKRLKIPNGYVRVKVHNRYNVEPWTNDLFGRWRIGKPGFSEKIDEYLSSVNINPSHTKGEGCVQERWSQVKEPWVPFDREAKLSYETKAGRERAKIFPKVEAAFDAIRAEALQQKWKEPEKRASKIDRLAVDQAGKLTLIELKKASAASVYCVPFQLLQYVWEWHGAMEAVQADLQMLIDARKELGLTPCNVAQLSGGIRAVVGFGPDNRSDEVKRRYNIVLNIVNQYLPPGVAPIETWKFAGNGPRRVP